jgi:hypothetical protein
MIPAWFVGQKLKYNSSTSCHKVLFYLFIETLSKVLRPLKRWVNSFCVLTGIFLESKSIFHFITF